MSTAPPEVPPPSPASPVIDYAPPKAQNPAATWALICGLLPFIPYITGILAIVLGRKGARLSRQTGAPGAGRARAGIILGYISIFLSILLTIASIPAYFHAREAARTVQCAANLRMTAIGLLTYATANNGWLPPALPPTTPVCPELLHANSAATQNYIYLRPATPITQIKSPGFTPIAFDPLSNHHNKTICVLWLDGHVSIERGPAAQKILALAPATRAASN